MNYKGNLEENVNNKDENRSNKLYHGLSKAELRKNNKPVMEKRRRARINRCLNELKSLILEAMKKDPARHAKLEKADILEMTVKHLQLIQRRQLSLAVQNDPTVVYKFKVGFAECTEEVKRYISQIEGMDSGTRQRLSNYLNNCVNNLNQIGTFTNFSNSYTSQVNKLFINKSPKTTNPETQFFQRSEDNNNGHVRIDTVDEKIPTPLSAGELAFSIANSNTKNSDSEKGRFTMPQYMDFKNNLHRISAFSKPNNAINPHLKYNSNSSSFSQSCFSTSPPLSPISSISSQEDDSAMHTSSDFASRSITPTQDESQNSLNTILTSAASFDVNNTFLSNSFSCQNTFSATENTGEFLNGYIAKNNQNYNQNKGFENKEADNKETNENMWRPW